MLLKIFLDAYSALRTSLILAFLFSGWKLDAMTDLHLRQLHTKLNVVQLIFNTKEVYFVGHNHRYHLTSRINPNHPKVCKAKSKVPSPTVAQTVAKNPR